jgi:hypothetical protein
VRVWALFHTLFALQDQFISDRPGRSHSLCTHLLSRDLRRDHTHEHKASRSHRIAAKRKRRNVPHRPLLLCHTPRASHRRPHPPPQPPSRTPLYDRRCPMRHHEAHQLTRQLRCKSMRRAHHSPDERPRQRNLIGRQAPPPVVPWLSHTKSADQDARCSPVARRHVGHRNIWSASAATMRVRARSWGVDRVRVACAHAVFISGSAWRAVTPSSVATYSTTMRGGNLCFSNSLLLSLSSRWYCATTLLSSFTSCRSSDASSRARNDATSSPISNYTQAGTKIDHTPITSVTTGALGSPHRHTR